MLEFHVSDVRVRANPYIAPNLTSSTDHVFSTRILNHYLTLPTSYDVSLPHFYRPRLAALQIWIAYARRERLWKALRPMESHPSRLHLCRCSLYRERVVGLIHWSIMSESASLAITDTVSTVTRVQLGTTPTVTGG